MSDTGSGVGNPDGGFPTGQRLESWKEIASYLRRDKRTVQRWEKEYGLPVHRLQLASGSTVYAYTSELDAWYAERQPPNFPAEAGSGNGNHSEANPPAQVSVVATADPNISVDPKVDVVVENGGSELSSDSDNKITGSTRWSVTRLQITVTLGLAALLGLFLFSQRFRLAGPKPATGKIRLVVLPLKNLSGDSQQDYFSAGLTDEMITQLGRLNPQRLGVIDADSSKRLAGKSIADVGRSLEVQYALEGSVRRGGKQVRIDLQLVQVGDQTQVWADSYTGDVGDILRVQDEVATAVAGQIRVALPVGTGSLSRTALAAARPVNAEAYDAYLQGRFYWTNRGDVPKSIEAYQQAIEKDRNYALAYAGLASGYTLLSQVPYDDVRPIEAKPKARQAAERALQLDANLAEAHAVLANVAFSYEWDFKAAEQEFQKALALDPNNVTAHQWYAHFCLARNRLAQAQEENAYTLDLDPVSPLFNTVRAEILYHERQYDAAIAHAQHTIEEYPMYWPAYLWLGSAYREKKMYPEALKAFSVGRKVSGDYPIMIALYGNSLALSGDPAGGHRALAELRKLNSKRYISALYFAAIYEGLGEKSHALDWLEKAYQERNDRLVYLAVDPLADSLRSEPRFRNLMIRIGLEQ